MPDAGVTAPRRPLSRRESILALVAPFAALAVGTVVNLHGVMVGHHNLFLGVRRQILVTFHLFPAVLLICGILTVGRSRRTGGTLLAAFALSVGMWVWMFKVEPNWLATRHVVIPTPKVTHPLRVVHFSDLQADGIDGNEERAVEAIIAARPDLVIHTGDLLQPLPPLSLESETPKAERLLSRIQPNLGFFNVVGDVDGAIQGRLISGFAGMRTLQSSAEVVERDDVRIRLLGLSLGESRMLHEPSTRERLDEFRAASTPGEITIVMGHAPDYMLAAREYPFDLCLAGHTHGGQVNLPFVGPLLSLSRVPREWARGFRVEGGTRLNVTTGVGAEHLEELPSMRLLCRPEIVVIDFVPAK